MTGSNDSDGQGKQIDQVALLRASLMQNVALTDQNAVLVDQVAALEAQNENLATQIKELAIKVVELSAERDKNSRNSNKPPSSDGLGNRRTIRRPKKPTGRKRGGQKGHKGHCRKLAPAAAVDLVIDIFPGPCELCQEHPPRVITADPTKHQVVELLAKGGSELTEYRLHTYECGCGEMLVASHDAVPTSAFGPHLKSVVCMLTGGYQMSRRQVPVFLNDLFGIKMSLGSVSNIEGQMSEALEVPSNEALECVEVASVKHIDETSWLRDFKPCSAWVIAYAAVSVFRIVANGRRSTLLKILQRKHRGILVSDRASVFFFWSMEKRQVCWSHLQRTFIGFSQRDGPAGDLGKDLATSAELVFGYWQQYRSGVMPKDRFEQWIEAVRKNTKQILERAADAGIAYVSGSCANMLKHWDAMWTFVNTPGVEPTNNHAERELRRLVMWRKRCFGTQSERGDRFVERMMTVTHTLRKQGRSVLSFLHDSFVAMLSASPAPKLVLSA